MLGVSSGHIEKLGLLFERRKRALYGYFYHHTSDPDLSEDLCQETFYRILKYRSGFKTGSRFGVWMYAIAKNVSADHFRKNKRFQRSKQLDNDWDVVAMETSLNGHHEHSPHEDEKLNKALEMLPPREKEILVLNRFQGLKYREIGELMNLSENGVKIAAFRAIRNLRTNYFLLDKIE